MRTGSSVMHVLLFLTIALAAPPAIAARLHLGEEYEVHASSELKSTNNAYAAKQAIPPSLGTAWCEGTAGDGVGEWLELTLKTPMTSDGGFKL